MAYLEELLPEFRNGAKIREWNWDRGHYIYLRNGKIYDECNEALPYSLNGCSDWFLSNKWEIYNDPELDWQYIIDNKYTLKNAKDGDVISAHFWNKKEQHGGGFSFLYVGGKEFIGEKDRRKPEQSKTLLQLVSEGYHLHIRGHWGDGQIIPGTPSKCRTWWNDPDNFTLIDLMTLNKFLLTNQK